MDSMESFSCPRTCSSPSHALPAGCCCHHRGKAHTEGAHEGPLLLPHLAGCLRRKWQGQRHAPCTWNWRCQLLLRCQRLTGVLIRAGGSGQRRLLRVPTNAAVLCWRLQALGLLVPHRNRAQPQFAAATMLCCCYQGTSAPCALAFFCLVLCLPRKALPQHRQSCRGCSGSVPPARVAQSPGAGISNAPVFSVSQPGTHCAHLQEGLGLPSLLPPPLCLLHSLGLPRMNTLPSPRQGLCLVSCLCSIPSLTEAALSLL